jgi:hypothetical protein
MQQSQGSAMSTLPNLNKINVLELQDETVTRIGGVNVTKLTYNECVGIPGCNCHKDRRVQRHKTLIKSMFAHRRMQQSQGSTGSTLQNFNQINVW